MKNSLINQAQKWPLMLCLLFPFYCVAEQFVELTAEIEINDWDYWLLEDKTGLTTGTENSASIFQKGYPIRCVVGTNTWMMEGGFSRNTKKVYWFTGTNIISHRMAPQLAKPTLAYESLDGNPARPLGNVDLLGPVGKITWLSFCSGSFLKKHGRQIPLPDDIWKETRLAFSTWSDETTVFEDNLGLPKRLTLVATNGQPVLQYQVRHATNMLGWSFPLEFYLVQYVAHSTNEWDLCLTAKGKVTSIKEGTKPEIPTEVWKAVEK